MHRIGQMGYVDFYELQGEHEAVLPESEIAQFLENSQFRATGTICLSKNSA